MQILITGGAGFIGSNLGKTLLEKNYEVIAVDNLITGNIDNIIQLKHYPTFTFVKHDITKPFSKTMNDKLSATNYIYHLACPTGVPNLGRLSEEMLLTSSVGTRNVLELAKKTRAKLLFTSSSEVYGDPQVFPQTEEYTGNVDPVGFRSPYEEGKRFSESLVTMYVRKYNLDAKIVRVFNTYGPRMSPTDTRVIPIFLRSALENKPLPVEGDGRQTRTFCYVDDLIEGLILVLRKAKKGETYNIGNNTETTILDLAKRIIKLTKSKSKIKLVSRPKHDHHRRLPDLSKAKLLGWKPKVSLEQGIQNTIRC